MSPMAQPPLAPRTPRRLTPRLAAHPISLTLLVSAAAGAAALSNVSAQSTDGSHRLVYETVISGGGWVGGGNPMRLITAVGEPIGGTTVNGTLRLRASYPPGGFVLPAGRRTIDVEGTIDDPTTTITVNGVPAEVFGTAFLARDIPIVEGPNVLTIVATDRGGNRTSASITVLLRTRPPARPTLQAPPPVAATSSMQLNGTKTPQTSVWINGREVVARNDDTTWTATIELTEGDNELVITTKDAAGNESTSAKTTIVLDREPPVITMAPPAKTNLTPLRLQGTVDDHLTQVAINGTAATQTGRAFELSVDLVEGENRFTIVARSPNGHTAEKAVTVVRGTVPTITGVQPAEGSKLYAGQAVSFRVTATDKEQDPLAYQFVLDGTAMGEWQREAETGWTPTPTQRGPHTLEVRARDDFGGSSAQTVRVYVVRAPIVPPDS